MQNELVLLHGWGMNAQVWQLVEPEIATFYNDNVRSLNLPGFGGSPMPDGDYTLASAAALIAAQLAPNSVVLGWSMGGIFALYLAKHFPDKVSKVILIASSPYFSESTEWAGIKSNVLEAFELQLQADSDKTIERFLAIQAMGSDNARDDIKSLRALLDQANKPCEQALSAGLRILKHEDLRQEMSEITQPIYGLFGRLDSLVPKRVIDKIAALNPNFQHQILVKASHAPFISHRAEFLSFLKSIL